MSTVPFRVNLSSYAGPIDLLLYLVKRDELDIVNLSLSRVIHQYNEFLEILSEIDVDNVSEFIETASILIELKSLAVLPKEVADENTDEAAIENLESEHLVYRLFQYKRFRDVANILDEQSLHWQQRFARMGSDMPVRRIDPTEQPIVDTQIWDLVSAFGRIMKANQALPSVEVIADDTPMHVHLRDIHTRIVRDGQVELQSLFLPSFHKTRMVALFLATLELTRHHGVLAVEQEFTQSIVLRRGPNFQEELQTNEIDDVNNDALSSSTAGFRGR